MNCQTTYAEYLVGFSMRCSKIFLSFFIFLCATSSLLAQWSVKIDRPSAMYEVGETAYFSLVSTYYGGPVEYQIVYDDYSAPLATGKFNISAGETIKIPFTTNTPGVVICKAKLYDVPATAAAAFSPFKIQPSEPAPTDFDAFWQNQRSQLQNLPFDPQLTIFDVTNYATTYRFNMANIDNRRTYGYLSIPKGAGPFPAIVNLPAFGNTHAAGAQTTYAGQNGVIILSLAIHNVEPDQYDYSAYLPNDIYTREGIYYRYPILGTIRAIDYLFSRSDFDKTNLGVCGASQGGGLAMLVGGIDNRVKAVAESNAALCDHLGLKYNRATGFPYYLNKARVARGDEAAAANAIKYYDAVYAAQRFQGSSLHVIGYEDEVCPPSSIFVAYNQFKGPKTLVHAIKLGHQHPNEYWEGRFDFFRKVFPSMRSVNTWAGASTETGYFIDIQKSNDNTNSVNLLAKVEKDEQEAASLPLTWSTTKGTGNVAFSPSNQRATKASFSANGDYLVTATATDLALLGTSQRYYTTQNSISITGNTNKSPNPTTPTEPNSNPVTPPQNPTLPTTSAATYCSTYSIFPWHEWIADVAFTDGQKSSDKSSYSDFSKGVITNIMRGKVKQGLFSAAYSWETHTEYWRVWIDFNKNNTFETNELVYESELPRPPNGTSKVVLWAEMQIPQDIALGETRMRIAMQRDKFPNSACSSVEYGEIEDYTVKIIDNIIIRSDQFVSDLAFNPSSSGLEADELSSLLRLANASDAQGTGAQSWLPQAFTLVLDKNTIANNISIFPNPANDVLNINLEAYIGKATLIKIVDSTGKVIYYQPIDRIETNIFSIPLTEYESGTYFLAVEMEGNPSEVRRFVLDKH
jgi:cephalosporin-C deacetylase